MVRYIPLPACNPAARCLDFFCRGTPFCMLDFLFFKTGHVRGLDGSRQTESEETFSMQGDSLNVTPYI